MALVLVRNTPVGIVFVSEVMTTGDSAGEKNGRSAIGLLKTTSKTPPNLTLSSCNKLVVYHYDVETSK